MENLFIGAKSWNHSAWTNLFYPEDMPTIWRLDFYANTYRTVLVPQAEWLEWDDITIEDMLDAVEGEFYFFFEWCGWQKPLTHEQVQTRLVKLEQIKQTLESKAAGVVVFAQNAEGLPPHLANMPVTLVADKAVLLGATWQWQFEGCSFSGNACAVIENLTTDAKQQAQILKQFMQSLPDNAEGAPFIVAGDVDIKELNNLKVIGELLGF